MYTVRGGDFGEVSMRPAVDVANTNDVGAGGEGLEDCGCCGAAG